MSDMRMRQMARNIINYSIAVKPGQKVLIDVIDDGDELAICLVEEIRKAGGLALVQRESLSVRRAWLMNIDEAQLELWYNHEISKMKDMDCYLAVRGAINSYELSDVPGDKIALYQKWYGKVHLGYRVSNTRWCVFRYPSPSLAQSAGMSSEAFYDHYYNACAIDYSVLSSAMDALKEALTEAKSVRIVSPGTDLSFSIDGIEAGKCAGMANIPDGEVCMGVVRESVNGRISYNIPSNYNGFVYTDIVFDFENGKIVKANCNDNVRINAILDTDEGSRYIGEFAIGVHPTITRHITDTLFDEKMAGSLHFTPGGTNSDGSRSMIHWDIVLCHTPEYGGGEIYLDGKLWRKDGLFVDESMQHLNPEPLKKLLNL